MMLAVFRKDPKIAPQPPDSLTSGHDRQRIGLIEGELAVVPPLSSLV